MIVGASCGSGSVLAPGPRDLARFPALADNRRVNVGPGHPGRALVTHVMVAPGSQGVLQDNGLGDPR